MIRSMDSEQSGDKREIDKKNIIEIYDFPEALKTTDLLSIFSEYRNVGFYIRWVNDTHALGVFRDSAGAQKALSKDHPPCRVRPLSSACGSCQHKASQLTDVYGRGRDWVRGRGRGRQIRNHGSIQTTDDATATYPWYVLSCDDEYDTDKKEEYEVAQIPVNSGNGHNQSMREPSNQSAYMTNTSTTNRLTNTAYMQFRSISVVSGSTTISMAGRENMSLYATHYCTKRKPQTRRMGITNLKEMAEGVKDPDSLLLEIVTPQSGFSEILNEKLKPELMFFVLEILVQSFRSGKKQTVLDLVYLLTTKNFILVNLSVFIEEIGIGVATFDNQHLTSLIKNICSLTCSLLQYMQSHLSTLNILIDSVERLASKNVQINEVVQSLCPEVMEMIIEMKAVRDRIQKLRTDSEEKRLPKASCENMQPPEDFRTLDILPVLKDIYFNEKPFLRANIIKGKYEDTNHYLDVQFRLLREDYLHPLRQGIMSYRQNLEFEKGFKKLQDIRVYENVHILGPVCSENGILHNLQFDTTKLRKVQWESSQRLMYGSLLCLTNNGFETIFFATVTNRDVEALFVGQVQVMFQDIEAIANYSSEDKFVMAETTAYFEAYRHVLKGLQEIQDDMPFQKYIVHCQPSTKPPKYLLQSGKVQCFDFSPILSPPQKNRIDVPVLNTSKWPSAEALDVDESQYKALQMAITKEVAIIQGPPGTGKTFIGLKIVQLLLHNKDIWTTKESVDPILVVCYTNHALDQFLLEISQYSKKLVRVGGRCSKDLLLKYTLQKYRENARAGKIVSKIVQERKYDCKEKLEESKQKIQNISRKINTAKVGILKLEELKPFISDNHINALQSPGSRSRLDEWLGFSEDVDHFNNSFVDERENQRMNEIMDRWVDELLRGHLISVMSIEKLKKVRSFRKLNLYERASVYKSLHTRFKRAVTDMLEEKTKDFNNAMYKLYDGKKLKDMELQIHKIVDMLNRCEVEIIQVKVLTTFFPETLRKLAMRLQNQIPVGSEFFEWICLDGSCSSIEKITACFEGKIKETEEVEEIFENVERHLDEDKDSDFHFATTKQCQEEIQLTNLSSASVSILSNSNIQSKRKQKHKWSVQISKAKLRQMLKGTLSGEAMPEDERNGVNDIWTLSPNERRRLYRFWMNSYISYQQKSTWEEIKTYSKLCISHNEAVESENIEIMSGADVIGMTTTGAAKNRSILQNIKPKIIVVEEAAEVLESHIITTLNPNCQHLILIGDHKQLRPTPTVYMLAKKYNLDISLFERMVNNKLNYATLCFQHRMRPEISVILKHIYPNLSDHPCVQIYENIQGIDSDVFFINHEQLETPNLETTSHSNLHEAGFVGSLCRYILQQGYGQKQITILTAYTGQVLALKRQMPRSEFEHVQITSVDNFQGEENDIIILSLVRSNEEQNAGFLKTDNRICVALSRARKGLYVIGNFDMLQLQSTLWQNIIETMKKQKKFGSTLTLRCQNHPLKATKASSEVDFDAMPNGGCKEICNYNLPCGHKCERFCHILDSSHNIYKCMKPCEKYCFSGHLCTKRCFEPCGECQIIVTKTNPYCGHKNDLPCSEDISNWKCPEQCKCILPCNHVCEHICYECKEVRAHLKCKKSFVKVFPCGHTSTIKCFQATENITCTVNCNEKLSCGHFCSGTCHECHQGRLHIACQEICQLQLICGHKCDQPCGNGCPPCEKDCMTNCCHDNCDRECKEICKICTDVCERRCMHQECDRNCYELCQISPCTETCSKFLACNHSCSGFCNEPCPTFCKICDVDKIPFISTFDLKTIQVIKLEGCGHEFLSTTLDRHIFYNYMVSNSMPVGLCLCPECFTAITKNERYMDIVKLSQRRVSIIKNAIKQDCKNMNEKKMKIIDALMPLRYVDQEAVLDLMSTIDDDQCTQQNICLAEMQLAILKLMCSIYEHMADSVLSGSKEEISIGEDLKNIRLFTFRTTVRKSNQQGNLYQKVKRFCFTRQEIEDIKSEFLRLAYQVNFLLFKEKLIENGEEILDSFQEMKNLAKKDLDKLKYLACRWKWEMFHKSFEEIDFLITYIEKERSVWRYGSWIKCRNDHIFQDNYSLDKGQCPSCEVDIGMDIHKQDRPSIPVPLPLMTDETPIKWEKRQQWRDKGKNQVKTSEGKLKEIGKADVLGFAVSESIREGNERPMTNTKETEGQYYEDPHASEDKLVIVKYCSAGHMLMRQENICRWCNVGNSELKDTDNIAINELQKDITVSTNISSFEVNGEVDNMFVADTDDREVRENDNPQLNIHETIKVSTVKNCNAGHVLLRNQTICRQCNDEKDNLKGAGLVTIPELEENEY